MHWCSSFVTSDSAMKALLDDFSQRYTEALRRFLADGGEDALHAAYELGREAIKQGLGVLAAANVHQQALAAVLLPTFTLNDDVRGFRVTEALKGLEVFFMENLSPFEAHHRGFLEANDRLRELNEALERRAAELAATNRELSHEITRRKASEEMWKRYESIVNTSREYLTLIASNYRYEAANDTYCLAHDKSRDDILGSTVAEVWGKAAFETIVRKYLDQCFAGEEVHYQSWFEMPSLGRRYFDVSYYPYRQKGGVTHAIVVTRDVTDRHEAEVALRESEEQFRTLMQSAIDAIILADSEGNIVTWNQGARDMFGRSDQDAVGRSIGLLMPQRYRRAHLDGIRKAGTTGQAPLIGRTVELHGLRQDGTEFPLELSLASWHTAKGRFFCGIIRDITERKRAEEALRNSEEHYRELFNEAKAMQEKLRDLSSKILHAQEEERKRISRELHDEVGQALTAISVNLQLLKKKAVRIGGDLDTQVAETQSLLEQTMYNVHRFSYELRPAMLDDLGLVVALRWYIRAFAKRTDIKVSLRADAAVEQLASEPKTVIYRVVQESLTNVYKYAGAGRVSVSLRKAGSAVHLAVKDDGRGFAPDRLVAGPKDKSGLGLMGMQERLRLVNGELAVQSVPGKGTTIRASIPFNTDNEKPTE